MTVVGEADIMIRVRLKADNMEDFRAAVNVLHIRTTTKIPQHWLKVRGGHAVEIVSKLSGTNILDPDE